MYKDPDKQREANRLAQAKFKAKGITKGITSEGITDKVLPKSESHVDASDVGTVKALHRLIKALPVKPERTLQDNIRVSKPGDADYVPQCETTRAFIEGRDKRPETAKRGKDIKCFDDLSPSVQQTIDTLSDDKAEHKRRTAIAINYQHLFPGRFHSVGVAG